MNELKCARQKLVTWLRASVVVLAAGLLTACVAVSPLIPHDFAGEPLVNLPAAAAGITDDRGRFREIFCAILEAREDVPDHRPCDDALTRLGTEPTASGQAVNLGASARQITLAIVPGVGWGCFETWLELKGVGEKLIAPLGYRVEVVGINALSGEEVTAAQIRDHVLAWVDREPGRELVLLGYSKGAPDILRALVDYPEIQPHVSAVVSLAGSIGGSPLAYDASQWQLDLLASWPEADCSEGDGKGLASLTPHRRQNWLAANPLPDTIPYFSVVALPEKERISSALQTTWRKLAFVDPRNDSQVIFYDQVIPGSTLLAYLNGDHWAVAVPIARSHRFFGSTLVDENDYPREALFEAILRYVEEATAPESFTGSLPGID